MKVRTLIILGLVFSSFSKAQTSSNPDELFKAARFAAYEEKNDKKAKALAKEALTIAPLYSEIQVFLGRLYSWNKNYDTASSYFKEVLAYEPANEDAIAAYADLEIWNGHFHEALLVCNKGLEANASSVELLLRKAKILSALKQYPQASQITDRLLKSNNRNADALALASSLANSATLNRIGLNYDYTSFGKQESKPWHLASITYSRNTHLGSISANVNHAKRYGQSGWQGEVEAYPHINKIFYGYLSFGYSPGNTVFPIYRGGLSLYANLPRSYEAEAGIRYMNFGTSTNVYTFYLGKYYSNFLFGARTYLTPGAGGTSQSYSFLSRYYLAGADDYIAATIGSGISPDDKAINIQYHNKSRLSSKQASIGFNHCVANKNIVSFKGAWLSQQDNTNKKSNQLIFSIGLQRKF